MNYITKGNILGEAVKVWIAFHGSIEPKVTTEEINKFYKALIYGKQ